jgi:hypothetical protein
MARGPADENKRAASRRTGVQRPKRLSKPLGGDSPNPEAPGGTRAREEAAARAQIRAAAVQAAPGATDPLALVSTNAGECARSGDPTAPCSSKRMIERLARIEADELAKASLPQVADAASAPVLPSAPTEAAGVIQRLATALECGTESCVLARVAPLLPRGAVEQELAANFKPAGPRGTDDLLSNVDIDTVLQTWATNEFPRFYPSPFAMMDFARNPADPLGHTSLADVVRGVAPLTLLGLPAAKRAAETFACVLNTDVSTGPGKHWVALFVDCRGGPADAWTVEYFNSAGNPPAKEATRWMERTRAELEALRSEAGHSAPVVVRPITSVDHQYSQTECGVYALFYIRSRLDGSPIEAFTDPAHPICDDSMLRFRAHLFRAAP